MMVKPIKSEADLCGCREGDRGLMDAGADTAEGDPLEVLSVLAEAWEREHHAIEPPEPVDATRFAMEQRGLSQRDLEPLIGSRAGVAEVLNRKRWLTLAMIRRLHAELGVPAEVLIRDSRTGKWRR